MTIDECNNRNRLEPLTKKIKNSSIAFKIKGIAKEFALPPLPFR